MLFSFLNAFRGCKLLKLTVLCKGTGLEWWNGMVEWNIGMCPTGLKVSALQFSMKVTVRVLFLIEFVR